jgi:hypothetical protein
MGSSGESSLPAGRALGERHSGFRAAAASLPRIVGPIVARHGGGVIARLKTTWAEIVGPDLAAASWPEALGRDGSLKLRVAPPKALEIQHRAPLVIERINLFFGRQAVTRLALVQGPLPLPSPPAQPLGSAPAPAAIAALDRQLDAVTSPELREALGRLGRRVIAVPP